MAVRIDPQRYTPSRYVHPLRQVKRCGECGCRIRGKHHEDGSHHAAKVKAPLTKAEKKAA